jgi:hypothetical protein
MSEDELVTDTLKVLDATFSADVALAKGYIKGPDAFIQRELARSLRSAFFAAEKQVIYGTGNDAGGFAGLADEYYNSSVAYSEFYPLDIEPWESNITTLVDFDSKWINMLDKKTPVPTPDKKKFRGRVGVFEGGGYAAKGVYRPAYDCLMNSFKGHEFCPACQDAIVKMINFYSE